MRAPLQPLSPLSAAMAQYDPRGGAAADDDAADSMGGAYGHHGEPVKPGDADAARAMPMATPLVFLPLDPIREGTCEFGDSNAISGMTGMSQRVDSEPLGRV